MTDSPLQPGVCTAQPWAFPLALLTACATFPLILLGGLVTTYDVGMAVPDAPSTFGHNMLLYPIVDWLRAPLGVFLEHGHRLFGSLVGLLSLLLAAALWSEKSRRWLPWLAASSIAALFVFGFFRAVDARRDTNDAAQLAAAAQVTRAAGMLLLGGLIGAIALFGWRRDRSRWARWAGVLALGLVVIQGGLGVLRVVLDARTVAVIHGFVAQVFFAYLVCLAAACSNRWLSNAIEPASCDAGRLRRLTAMTTGFVLIQLLLGAMLRHLGFQWTLVAHLVVAFLIVVHVGLLGKLILTRFGDNALLVWGMQGAVLLVLSQLMLGAGAWATSPGFGTASAPPTGAQVFFATAHAAVGALILASLSTLTMVSLCYSTLPRSIEPRGERDRAGTGRRESSSLRPSVSALESRELWMVEGAI